MASISLDEFERQVMEACTASRIIKSIATVGTGLTWLHLRAYLVNATFVDIFYNQSSGKTAFAQIYMERRIFGADNAGGWHWHPLKNPQGHVSVEHEISFREFLILLEAGIKNENHLDR